VGIFSTCKYFATENWVIHTFFMGKKCTFFALGMGPFNGPKERELRALTTVYIISPVR
jgi:hypothetical protein